MVEKIKPLVRATRRPGADGEIGGFGGLFDLKAAGFTDPVLVAANDGVGTKLKIAIDAGKHDTIGIDLVAMCVNDLVVQGAEPLFFLDYFATGKLDPDQGAAIVGGIAEGCRQAGCALIGGETAEMPGLYRDKRLRPCRLCRGRRRTRPACCRPTTSSKATCCLGLASSGLHSNGFSLVRRIVEVSGLGWADPAPFAERLDAWPKRCSSRRASMSSRCCKAIRNTHGIKALAHITGGGFPDNIPRVLPEDFSAELDLDAIDVPPSSRGWPRRGGVAPEEMMRTFNCGIGMVIVVAAGQAAQVAAVLQEAGETVTPIGRIVPRRDAGVIYRGSIVAMSTPRKKVGILISGRGSNMAALIEAAAERDFPAEIARRRLRQAECAGPRARRRERHPVRRHRALEVSEQGRP